MTGVRRLAVLSLCLLGALRAAAAADAPPPPRDEIQRFVRSYLDANNQSDPTAVLDMVSRRPDVSMAEMGSINRGFESIRAEIGKLSATPGTHTVSLGALDITPLGPGFVLVVASIDVDLGVGGNQAQLKGAMTLVLEKSTGRWKVLHEHDSLHFPLGDFLGNEPEGGEKP